MLVLKEFEILGGNVLFGGRDPRVGAFRVRRQEAFQIKGCFGGGIRVRFPSNKQVVCACTKCKC